MAGRKPPPARFRVRAVQKTEAMGGEAAKFEMECADGSGTTITLALVSAAHIVVANVGDSRAVLGRRGAGAVALSHEQRRDRTRQDGSIRCHWRPRGGLGTGPGPRRLPAESLLVEDHGDHTIR